LDYVKFFIDGIVVDTIFEPPYTWTWSERSFGRNLIKIVAFDTVGNSVEEEMFVWKFF
jgi:hypothetical protein